MKKLICCIWLSLVLSHFCLASTATCARSRPSQYVDGTNIDNATTVYYRVYRAKKVDLSDAASIGTTWNLSYIDRAAPRKVRCYYFVKAYVDVVEGAKSNVGEFFTNRP